MRLISETLNACAKRKRSLESVRNIEHLRVKCAPRKAEGQFYALKIWGAQYYLSVLGVVNRPPPQPPEIIISPESQIYRRRSYFCGCSSWRSPSNRHRRTHRSASLNYGLRKLCTGCPESDLKSQNSLKQCRALYYHMALNYNYRGPSEVQR